MDWNWFFSSLAQSTAAIVGIFAAFIITKVINSQAEFSKKSTRLRKLLATSERHREALNKRSFAWYANQSLEQKLKEVENLLAGGTDASPEEYWVRLEFPEYVAREKALKRIAERIERFHAENRKANDGTGAGGPAPAKVIPQLALSREKEAIDALVIEIKQHIRLAELHLSDIEESLEPSSLIKPSILGAALLFIVGVILPLTLLPAADGQHELPGFSDWMAAVYSVKGLLLLIILVIFLGILYMFWRVDSSTRHDREEVEKLREITMLETYSPFLLISSENTKLMEEWLSSEQRLDEDWPTDVEEREPHEAT